MTIFPRTRPDNSEQRIALGDTPLKSITSLSEGVPGAITVMVDMMKTPLPKECEGLMMGPPLGPLFSLDCEGIYGSNIWCLYKDACGEDLDNMFRVLGCLQQGLLDHNDVANVIEDPDELFTEHELCTRINGSKLNSEVPDGLDQPTESELEELAQLASGIDPEERKAALDDLCDRLVNGPTEELNDDDTNC
jgi:hypothetical protein